MTSIMGKVFFKYQAILFLKMEISIQEISSKENSMELVNSYGKMEVVMKENGIMKKKREKEFMFMRTKMYMKEILVMTFKMDLEL